ncbi:MAG: YvcK family protein [Chloroflexales bacterium]|nr:YvcK family protein [Chloroflexales bacterium]
MNSPNTAAKRLVAIGGGGGAGHVLRGALPFFDQLTAVIAVTDTGRSTGLARAIAQIPAPGDVRSTIAAMASDPDALLPRLLQHRLRAAALPELEGMAFGNLLLGALAQLTGDFGQAVTLLGTLVGTEAAVLPVSTADTQLCAELADGRIVEGELHVRGLNKPPIRRLFLADQRAPAYAPALQSIAQADVVALGPGSLFTTVLATLLFDGMRQALRDTRAQVVYICNTTTQPGQTDGYTAFDHIAPLVELLGPGALDAVLINRSDHDEATLARHAAHGVHLLRPDDDELARMAALGVRALARDFAEHDAPGRQLWNKQDTIRHDPEVIGMALHKLALDVGSQ